MYNRQVYQNNNRGVFIPLVIGGIIGYGLGNNNRPNYDCKHNLLCANYLFYTILFRYFVF